MGSGLKRCVPRPRGANARASRFSRDLSSSASSPGWYLREAFRLMEMAPQFRAQSYRFVEGAPSAFSLHGVLENQGFV